MQGRDPVTGKMPVPQVLLLKDQHYIDEKIPLVKNEPQRLTRTQRGDFRSL
jgi:hypothetical protein